MMKRKAIRLLPTSYESNYCPQTYFKYAQSINFINLRNIVGFKSFLTDPSILSEITRKNSKGKFSCLQLFSNHLANHMYDSCFEERPCGMYGRELGATQ